MERGQMYLKLFSWALWLGFLLFYTGTVNQMLWLGWLQILVHLPYFFIPPESSGWKQPVSRMDRGLILICSHPHLACQEARRSNHWGSQRNWEPGSSMRIWCHNPLWFFYQHQKQKAPKVNSECSRRHFSDCIGVNEVKTVHRCHIQLS
jgi:hypothetical protein